MHLKTPIMLLVPLLSTSAGLSGTRLLLLAACVGPRCFMHSWGSGLWFMENSNLQHLGCLQVYFVDPPGRLKKEQRGFGKQPFFHGSKNAPEVHLSPSPPALLWINQFSRLGPQRHAWVYLWAGNRQCSPSLPASKKEGGRENRGLVDIGHPHTREKPTAIQVSKAKGKSSCWE